MKALVVVLVSAALALGTSLPSWAEDTASSAQQVEQLQKQLADMQKQMAEMQKTLQSANLPADQRQNMMSNMGMMQKGWQGMHQGCCMMNPAACPGMAMPPANP
jgi:TolA-binding protein